MYQVKVLSDSEFESLPYPEMETSLGVADPATNTAYVRYTGVGEVDKYLVNHELEHLIEGAGGVHSSHYENGVYYKKFGEIVENVLPMAASFIPGIGPIAGPATAAVFQARKAKKASGGGGFQEEGAPSMHSMHRSSGGFGSGSPMDSFEPQKPNIVTPGGMGGTGMGTPAGGTISGMMGGRSPIERVRGFFTSRNPQGGL